MSYLDNWPHAVVHVHHISDDRVGLEALSWPEELQKYGGGEI